MDANHTANEVPVPVMNSRIVNLFENGDAQKIAQATSKVIRTSLREGSVAQKIIVPEKATDDMLDRDLDERLRIICEIEGDSPAARWVPFQTAPRGEYMFGPRFAVPMARIQTPRLQKDLDELRTYRHDLRKELSKQGIQEGLAAYDGAVFETFNRIVTDTAGNVPGAQRISGKVQWAAFSGGLTKWNLTEAMKMLPRGNAEGRFRMRNHMMVMNDVTAQDLKKLDVPEIGDENVSKVWRQGLTSDVVLGLKMLVTIKDDLVPDERIWFFPEQEFLGNAYYLTDWTQFVKIEATNIEMYSYYLGGYGIGNIAGVCRADFDLDIDS